MKSFRYYILISLVTVFANPASATPVGQHLQKIDHQINSLKHAIRTKQHALSTSQAKLKTLELDIAAQTRALSKTQHTIATIKQRLEKLKVTYHHFQDVIRQTKQQLANNLRAQYRASHQPMIKHLLAADTLTRTQEELTYVGYLNQDRLNALQRLQQTLILAAQNIQQQTQAIAVLKDKQHEQMRQLKTLESSHQQRQHVLAQLHHLLKSKSQHLHQLLRDKKRLEQTLRSLNHHPLFFESTGKPFDQLKHHLHWPTTGKLVALYGQRIGHSQLHWNGVLFRTKSNTPVYAVADGKIIFANWLPGYGLLMIVYHGHGFMTLYGRNQFLYVHVGDTVKAGQQIGMSGISGGYHQPGLYFEIRLHSQPINPMMWFKHT